MQRWKVSDYRHSARHARGGADPLPPEDIGAAPIDAFWNPRTNYERGQLVVEPNSHVAYAAEVNFTSGDVFAEDNLIRIGVTGSTVTSINGVGPDGFGNVSLSWGTAADLNTGTNEGDVPVLQIGGKLANSVIPALAINDIYTAGSEAEMLALVAQRGDMCVRTDQTPNRMFILKVEPATDVNNWILLSVPDGVVTINGQTGSVVLGAADVGADPAGSALAAETSSKNYTDAQIANVISTFGSKGYSIFDNGDVSGNVTIDVSDGKAHKINIIGDTVLGFTGWEASKLSNIPLIITNNNRYKITSTTFKIVGLSRDTTGATVDVEFDGSGGLIALSHDYSAEIQKQIRPMSDSVGTAVASYGSANMIATDEYLYHPDNSNTSLYRYTFSTDTWTSLNDLTNLAGSTYSPTTLDRLVIFHNPTTGNDDIYQFRYNSTRVSTDGGITWTTKTAPTAGYFGSTFILTASYVFQRNNNIYFLIGDNPGNTAAQNFLMYSPAADTWTKLASFDIMSNSSLFSYYPDKDALVKIGGYQNSTNNFSNQVSEYNFASNTWSNKLTITPGYVVIGTTVPGKTVFFGFWAYPTTSYQWNAFVYDYTTNTLTQKSAFTVLPVVVGNNQPINVYPLPNGKVLALWEYTTIWLWTVYDPATDIFTDITSRLKYRLPSGRFVKRASGDKLVYISQKNCFLTDTNALTAGV